MRLKGARCLVTGGSRGIGLELAKALAESGARVRGCGRDRGGAAALEAVGGTFVQLDVTDADAVARELDRIGRVDVLVNNAGLLVSGAVEEIHDEDLVRQYETNVFAPWRLCRTVIPGMRARGFGAIVNMCSIGGELPYPGLGAYRSSKFALRCLSWTLHLELARFGVRVLNVEPGAVETDFARRSSASGAGVSPESAYAEMRSEAGAAYARIAPTRTPPEAVAMAIIEELRKDSGPVDIVIGEDARRLAALSKSGMDAYERHLAERFGFRWHSS